MESRGFVALIISFLCRHKNDNWLLRFQSNSYHDDLSTPIEQQDSYIIIPADTEFAKASMIISI